MSSYVTKKPVTSSQAGYPLTGNFTQATVANLQADAFRSRGDTLAVEASALLIQRPGYLQGDRAVPSGFP